MSNLACHTDRMNIESVIYKSIIPDGQPQELAAILDEIVATIKQFVIIGEEEAIALAVWVVHTCLFRQRDAVAYVAIQSPEKRCGKTTLLSVLAGLADKALVASNVSVGALFRAIDEAGPTLMEPPDLPRILEADLWAREEAAR
jgi:putative DNA primase/helicase